MEFHAHQSELLDELDLLQGAVERRSTIPILSHFLLETVSSKLQISASDLEVGARSSCRVELKSEGKAAVPARRLVEIIRSLPDGEIRFKLLENHWVHITCQRSSFKLASMATDNFPALPELPKSAFTVPGDVLAGLIDRTMFAASQDENRFSLNGLLLLPKPNSVSMVATDGHRLALAERRQAVAGVSSELRMLIPSKALGQLRRLLGESGEGAEVAISKDDSHLFFSVGGRLLISRQLTGQFPNYEAVLPRENDKVVELGGEVVGAAIRRVALLADEHSHAVRLRLEPGRLEIFSFSGEYGEAQEVVDIAYAGPALRVGFNYQYLLDFFAAVGKTEPVRMELKDEQSAVQFTPVDQDTYGYKYILMPMRA
jgi:DNA polymerase III subunit beta